MKYKMTLIIVALVGFCTFMGLHLYFYWNLDGLYLNLAAVFLQILIAVLLVDYLLDRNEKAQWKGFEARMQRKVVFLANFTLLEIRSVLGMQFSHETTTDLSALDSLRINQRIYTQMKGCEDEFATILQGFSHEQWTVLIKGMRLISSEIDRTMLLYFSKFEPRQLELLSELQERIDLVVLFPEVFPNTIESFRSDSTADTSSTKEQIVQEASEKIKDIIKLTAELVDTVNM